MIGTISIECNAKNPNMPLWPLRAYVNSPSSLRIRNVPKKIGQWEITSVQVTATYPDKTQKTAQCVLVGGVWVGTIEGSPTAGSYTNGYTVLADGIDENGNPVSGYVLGRGDVEILKEDGTPIEDPTHFVTDDELEAAISSKAEISAVDDVANDLTDLSNSLSDYYTKSETSSATEIQTALDGKQPTGDYALSSQLPTKTSQLSNDSGYITSAQVEPSESVGFAGYAEKSRHSAFVTAIDYSTGKPNDKAILAGEFKTNATTGELELDFSSEIVGKYPWTLRELFETQYSPEITLNWKKASIYRKRIISDRVVWAFVKQMQWMWVADGQFAITTDAAGEPDGNFYVLYYEDETHKNCINDPATDVHQITIENTVGDNIRIATIDGQTGQIDCYSLLRDYPLSIRALAYRDELSAKADVSTLNDYALTSQLPTKTSELSNDSGYITSAQVEPDHTYIGFSKSSHNALRLYNINNGVVYDNLNSLWLDNGQPFVEGTEYYPWQLTKWFNDTFATPLQLEFKYIGNIQVPLMPSMPIPTSKTINQYGWIASSGQLTHYIIKAEHTSPTNPDYFEATAIGKFDAPSSNFMPITISNDLKSVETVNGESGVVTCTRTNRYKTTNKTLAFRDELSTKADLSALENYLPLSGDATANVVTNSLSADGRLITGDPNVNDTIGPDEGGSHYGGVLIYDGCVDIQNTKATSTIEWYGTKIDAFGVITIKEKDAAEDVIEYDKLKLPKTNTQAYSRTIATQEWVLEQLSALEARIAALENN